MAVDYYYYCSGDTARIRSCRKAVKMRYMMCTRISFTPPPRKISTKSLEDERRLYIIIYENRYLYTMSYIAPLLSVTSSDGRLAELRGRRPMILGWERKRREKKRASWKMKCRTGGRSPDRDRSYTFKHLGVHTLPVAKLACCLRGLDISYI